MECERYNEKLSALCDGALSHADSERVRAHLDSCRRCTEDLAELKALKALLRGLPQPEPRTAFWADTHRKVRLHAASGARPARRLFAPRMHIGWGIAAAAIFVVGILAAPRRIDQTPLPREPAIHVAALVSLHANLRADRPLEDTGSLRFYAAEATAADLADDNKLDVD